MSVLSLAELLLSPEEKNEMQNSVQMLQAKDISGFYDKNQSIVCNILFIESVDEFLDFSNENSLDIECFCAAFLCAKGYGIQVGGYEDDLTHSLTEFFKAKGIDDPKVFEIINSEKIYTDCNDYDNFKKSLTAINQVLSPHGVRVIVVEDFVYCDCEYTVLIVDNALADKMASLWQSDSFEIYL